MLYLTLAISLLFIGSFADIDDEDDFTLKELQDYVVDYLELEADATVCQTKKTEKTCKATVNNGNRRCKFLGRRSAIAQAAGSRCLARSYIQCKKAMGLNYCCNGVCAGQNGNPPPSINYMIAHPDITEDEYDDNLDILEAFDMDDAEIAAYQSVCKGLDKATCESTTNKGNNACKYFDRPNNAIALEAGSQCVAKAYQRCKRRRGITAICGITARPPASATTFTAAEIIVDEEIDDGDDITLEELVNYKIDYDELDADASICVTKKTEKTCKATINNGNRRCKYLGRRSAIAQAAGSRCLARSYIQCKKAMGLDYCCTGICAGPNGNPPKEYMIAHPDITQDEYENDWDVLEAFDMTDAEIAADASVCKGLDKTTCENTVNTAQGNGQTLCKYFDKANNAIALEAGSQCVAKSYQKCKRRRGITAICGITARPPASAVTLKADEIMDDDLYDDDFGTMEVWDYMDDAEIEAYASLCKGLDKNTCENTINKGQQACKYFARPNNAIALEAGSQCVAKAYQKCKRRRGITAICGITARPPASAVTLPLLEAFDISDAEIAADASLCKGLDKATCESTVNKGANACKYFDRPNNAIALEAGSQCVAKAYQKCKRRRGITATCGIAGRDITAEEEYYDNMSDEEIAADAAVCKGLDETTCKNTVNTAQGNGKETCHYFEKPNNSIALQAGSQCVAKAYQRCKRRRGLTATCGIAGRGVPALESILMVEPIDMNNEDIDYMRWSLIGIIGLIVFGGLYKMFKEQNGKKYTPLLLEDKDYGATQSV